MDKSKQTNKGPADIFQMIRMSVRRDTFLLNPFGLSSEQINGVIKTLNGYRSAPKTFKKGQELNDFEKSIVVAKDGHLICPDCKTNTLEKVKKLPVGNIYICKNQRGCGSGFHLTINAKQLAFAERVTDRMPV